MNSARLFSSVIFALLLQVLHSQHVIRGIVADEAIKQPLVNALVYLVGYENQAVVTAEDGSFSLKDIGLGRYVLQASYLGYESFSTSVEVISGKQLVMQIEMKEDIQQLQEVVVKASSDKSRAVNSMAYASTRTFSVEETSRYAGAVDDPARMAQSFAGVIPTNDGNNYISIRGNHPSALLYRMEGIDIPNPNHFGDVASSGGGVSVLSSQMLSNSDFSTGAFSAEYGNAIGGVFDLKLRKGNNQKREYTFKAGFLGLEAAAEGPFAPNYKGSYLINYRYSTLSLINKLGVDLAGVLNYSDLSYHVYLPLKSKGVISLFGINGWSSQEIDEGLEDNEDIPGALSHQFKGEFLSNMSVNGVKYFVPVNKSGYFTAIGSFGTSRSGFSEDVLTSYPDHDYFSKFDIQNLTDKWSLALSYTQKLKPGMLLRSGTYFDRLGYQMTYDKFYEPSTSYNLINSRDQANMLRAFTQLQYTPNKRWEFNAGLHLTHFFLNQTKSLEFRGNAGFHLNDKSTISLAYGRHSQIQPLIIYDVKSLEGNKVNENLDLSRAHHFVLTFDHQLNKNTRLKTELYHQALSGLPTGKGENASYALVNQQFFFPDFALESKGKGRNTGLELSLERFFSNQWYFLLTASLFDSKYKTPTTDWLNTRYNTKFAHSLSLGKEWNIGKSNKKVFGVNLKSTVAGGQFDTPIDRAASQLAKKEIRDNSRPFSQQLSPFYKLDLGVRYKINKSRVTSSFSLDLMNATNHKNVGGLTYHIYNDKITEWATMPLVPVFSYKLQF